MAGGTAFRYHNILRGHVVGVVHRNEQANWIWCILRCFVAMYSSPIKNVHGHQALKQMEKNIFHRQQHGNWQHGLVGSRLSLLIKLSRYNYVSKNRKRTLDKTSHYFVLHQMGEESIASKKTKKQNT